MIEVLIEAKGSPKILLRKLHGLTIHSESKLHDVKYRHHISYSAMKPRRQDLAFKLMQAGARADVLNRARIHPIIIC
jgi:hypothetical protein